MVALSRTRLSAIASLIALLIPTVLSLGAGDLLRVQDEGQIPTGVPTPHLPHLSLLTTFHLVVGAAAVAVIVLGQGTGVAEAAPNPDGSRAEPNRDFIGQSIGNIASGLFRGQPVGGSVSQTALNVAAVLVYAAARSPRQERSSSRRTRRTTTPRSGFPAAEHERTHSRSRAGPPAVAGDPRGARRPSSGVKRGRS